MAYDFDGSGDYIIFNKSAAATDLSVISYSFNVTREAAGTNRNIFWNGGAWDSNYHSFVQYDNALSRLCLVANWTSSEARWSVPNTADDTLYHNHVITYDFGASTNDPVWYIDGVSQTITEVVGPSGSAGNAADDGTITFGAYDDGSAEYWDGKIAEFGIWNRALTATEAAILGKGYSPLFIPNGLVFYAPFVRGVQDLKGGGIGTITNAVVSPHPRIINPSNYNIAPFATVSATGSVDWPKFQQSGFWRS